MPRLLIDAAIPYIRGYAEQLGSCTYLAGSAITQADAAQADILIIRTRTRCDSQLLHDTPVRFIATATIGFDHLDTDYLRAANIGWANCPGCNARSVAQYVETSLLQLAEAGHINLNSCTVGIVGVGHVGTAVLAALHRYPCRLLLCDPFRQERGESGFVSLETLINEADVITFHTPLTQQGPHPTYHLADASFFHALRRRPVLINAARGGVVDDAALVEALAAGRVRAAVIDTWEGEPRLSLPLLHAAFIATPHIAGYSADGKATATRMALQAVCRHLGLSFDFSCIQPPALPQGFAYNPENTSSHLALRLYDPLLDTAHLRACPAEFESLRANYPLRREQT